MFGQLVAFGPIRRSLCTALKDAEGRDRQIMVLQMLKIRSLGSRAKLWSLTLM